jgi:hypothetical protein
MTHSELAGSYASSLLVRRQRPSQPNVTNYLPDVEVIKQNGVRVFVAVGKWAQERRTWYAQTASILSEQLGCELVTFPGHHGSFMDMPVEWAATLRRVLHEAEA